MQHRQGFSTDGILEYSHAVHGPCCHWVTSLRGLHFQPLGIWSIVSKRAYRSGPEAWEPVPSSTVLLCRANTLLHLSGPRFPPPCTARASAGLTSL